MIYFYIKESGPACGEDTSRFSISVMEARAKINPYFAPVTLQRGRRLRAVCDTREGETQA